MNEEEIVKLINYKLSLDQSLKLVEKVTKKEIKDTLFAINNNKTLGLNGFGALFFKAAHNIMCKDFIATIRYFFISKNLLREVNYTTIFLIPKCFNLCFRVTACLM